MQDPKVRTDPTPPVRRLTVASVNYLNARPLIHGLEEAGVRLLLDVPARLADLLVGGHCDAALLPVIDLQRIPDLRIIPVGGIGCDGPTMTVRVFSRTPIGQIRRLACDGDSHTSVALARIILAESYSIRPEFVPLERAGGDSAVLLIGDKVVRSAPADMPVQLDMGEAWKDLTGLPFVFAIWTARFGTDLDGLPKLLERARERGLADLSRIADQSAARHGWPVALALDYYRNYLRFDISERQLQAMRLFWDLARKHNLLEHDPWPVA
jgi:chorismate dehydratase